MTDQPDETDGVEVDIDLYDSEVLTIQQVLRALNEKVGTNPSMLADSWKSEIEERFADAGFKVEVRMFNHSGQDHLPEEERTWFTKIYVRDRVEQIGEFDHDQMGHEVRSNIRGLNPQGDVQKKQVGQTGFESRKSGLIVPKG